MSEKKSFFASLEPKSALLVGMAGGLLALGTIGFIVMGMVFLRGNSTATAGSEQTLSDNSATSVQPPANIVKAQKPVVELYIMSYCPFGLQMQKAFLPVMELLKGKADLSVKWVYYVMHDKKEIDENTRQYCIGSEQSDKYIAYAKCFTTSGDYQSCLSSTGVNTTKLDACVKATDSKFGLTKSYNDLTTWLSGAYPLYGVNADLNTKYQVQGSPTLVINGSLVANVNRSPEAVKQAVCASFNSAPSECDTVLSSAEASINFGAGTGTAGATAADCGV
ncbi:MAG: hypothetical protein COU31_00480 [Candidatus Magasanikbacteria bacterium CG10_big_fil_rev_8_21_14_0_10_40_10]|uniref:Thioredoxin-like fold domain-containing protein n=1 Tax=Candidatus Magasanikbacteria bacterium CG10_big_fil_rev_8_21_14_0_10_40_10 TaxID=1974648 RepID=A0A2M6W508_9BACT|nr:MAG: hypothetical protein COU31_00480 [Candidatus Magasanikbacteria bacterium CG10_big_fil_rev_8_21_14_0_10_40_10]